MTDKKINLTPFEKASENSKHFAINMYTFYLFQKTCDDLLMADKIIETGLENTQDPEELERLYLEYQKNAKAWLMIMELDKLAATSCYAEA